MTTSSSSNVEAKFLSFNKKFILSGNIFTKRNVKFKKTQFYDVISTSSDAISSKCLYLKKYNPLAQTSKLHSIPVSFWIGGGHIRPILQKWNRV